VVGRGQEALATAAEKGRPPAAHLRRHRGLTVSLAALRAGPPAILLLLIVVLSLLSDVAADRPLICLVDDSQWLDKVSAQILAFVARRVLAESVALVFAVREPSDTPELAGLPQRTIGGLSNGDARALLNSSKHASRVRRRSCPRLMGLLNSARS
jgi:hypothetical protein